MGRQARPNLGEVTSIRFPPDTEAAMRAQAAREGKNMGEWMRGIVGQEIARREGLCPTCGQPQPAGASHG